MRTNLKMPFCAEPRSQQSGAAGVPGRLTAAMENVDGDAGIGPAHHRQLNRREDQESRERGGCSGHESPSRAHHVLSTSSASRWYIRFVQDLPISHLKRGRSALQTRSPRGGIADVDDLRAPIMVHEGMCRLEPCEVTANYPGVLAEGIPIDGDGVAPGQPLVRLHPLAGAR